MSKLTKLITIILVLILAVFLSACGVNTPSKNTAPSYSPSVSAAETNNPDASITDNGSTDANASDTSGSGDLNPTDTSGTNINTTDAASTDSNPSDTPSPDTSPSPSDTTSPSTSPTDTTSPDSSSSPSPSSGINGAIYRGYLVDQKTATKGKDAKGDSMKTHPEKLTVAALKSTANAASGYGLEIKQKSGVYKYYRLDAAGTKMVKRYILDKTTQKSGLMVAVKGKLSGNTIKVTTVFKSA